MMNCSFDGIGQWAATFPRTSGDVGQVVGLDPNGAACECSGGGDFLGLVLAVGRDGAACSVVLGGIVTVPCSGGQIAPGWASLAADGSGGVMAKSGGRSFRVLACDGDSVTFIL